MLVLRLTFEEGGVGLIATITQVADVLTGEALWRRSADVDEIRELVWAFIEDFVRRGG